MDYGKFAVGMWRRGADLMSVLEPLGLCFSLAIIFLKTKTSDKLRINMKQCQGLSLVPALARLGFQLLVLFSPSTLPSPSTLLSLETKGYLFFFFNFGCWGIVPGWAGKEISATAGRKIHKWWRHNLLNSLAHRCFVINEAEKDAPNYVSSLTWELWQPFVTESSCSCRCAG